MSGGHAHHSLYVARDTPVHRLPAHCKLVALVAFVLAVVLTPRGVWWPYAVSALALAVVIGVSRVPAATVLRRMVVELPFVVFALLLPVFATGPRSTVLGVSVSRTGLDSAGILLAKGTLGVVASIVLAATTPQREILLGLRALRLPDLLVQIMSFMFRYVEVVGGEMRRMRVARESRGFTPRHLGHLPVVAHSAGALFIRCYERGERVHLAMLSRGYDGRMPVLSPRTAGPAQWGAAGLLPAVAGVAVLAARLAR